MKTKSIISSVAGVALLGLLVGCASTKHEQADQQALACPGCKQVTVLAYPNQDGSGSKMYRKEHKCEGCQGSLATFLKEGKWEHRCSMCADQPWSCKWSKHASGK